MILRKASAAEDQHSVREIDFSEHRLFLRIPNLDGRMIAFGPAHALETKGAPGDRDGRNEQGQKSNAEESHYRDVALHLHGIRDWRMFGIDLGLDAQIIISCGNAGNDDGV